MNIIKKTPLTLSGVSLSLFTLANVYASMSQGVFQALSIFALLILILVTLTILFDFKRVQEDLKNVVQLSVFPTYGMATILCGKFLSQYSKSLGLLLYYLGIAIVFAILFIFIKRHVVNFDIKTVLPSWFVGFVGCVVGSVVSPAFGTFALGQILFYIGLVLYLILLPVVLYRLNKYKEIPKPAMPTFFIMAAPPNLLLAGYLSAFAENKNEVLVYCLLALATAFYIFALSKLKTILDNGFFPSYAALTFPMAIAALAFKLVGGYLGLVENSFYIILQNLTLIIATCIIGYVVYTFIKYYNKVLKVNNEDK